MALRLSSAASKGTLLLLCLLVAEFSVGAGQKDFLTTEWTTPTNGVKAALRFPSITSGTNFSEFQIQIVVSSASINRIRIWMPPENQLLRLDLLDSKGKPVQKTSRGKRLNSPLAIQPRPLDRQGFRTVLAQKDEMSSVTWFRLSDFFEDAPDGNYVLHSSATVCVDEHAPNHQPVAFVLADITVNIIK